MKIIGATEDGVLISAKRQEVAQLIGFYYHGASGCPEIIPGLEIKVSDMYEQLKTLGNNSDTLKDVAAKLRVVADLLTLQDPVVKRILENKNQ